MNKGMVQVDQERLRAQLEKKLPPKVRLFQLDDIPGVMRSRMGWPVAAALMERWFRGAAFEMPDLMKQGRDSYRLSRSNPAHLDESTVTMAWALGFARVRAAMAKLQAQWASPAGKAQLRLHVKKRGDIEIQPRWRFGNLALPAKLLDESCQVNFVSLGSLADPLDDFYGAMGEALLKVAVSGIVTSKGPGQTAIAIDEMGFYLRDSYDFNDPENAFLSQPLGFWGHQGVHRFHVSAPIAVSQQDVQKNQSKAPGQTYFVQNTDFRQWRALNGRGGDFLVLSNVHRIHLPFPIKLEW